MKNNFKLYLITLFVSLILFLLETIIFKFSGALGLSICIISLYLLIGSIIRLFRLSDIVDDKIMERIDILFF